MIGRVKTAGATICGKCCPYGNPLQSQRVPTAPWKPSAPTPSTDTTAELLTNHQPGGGSLLLDRSGLILRYRSEWGVFCLIGLVGWGSIPLHLLCLGGLLTFCALWALAYAVGLSTTNGKENPMKTEQARTDKPTVAASSLANTIWTIGTSTWSGLALSGKALPPR